MCSFVLVRFDVQKAETLASERKWAELEQYILKFCPGGHKHPSVTFAIYEASITLLIEEGKIEEAIAVFESKVNPLKEAKDYQFWPIDMNICIDELHKCIQNRYRQPLICGFCLAI